MKRAVLIAVVGGAVVLFGACDISHNHVTGPVTGSGELVTESRPVGSFTAVSVSGAGHLIIDRTGVESLEITAEDHLLPHIRAEVVDERLVLGFVPGVEVSGTRPVEYRLTVRDLTGIEASGASRVEAHGLRTRDLATVLSGASFLDASGEADAHVLVVSGASRAEASELASRVTIATVSGSSLARLRVTDSLVATASGASTLEYYGDPAVIANVSGGSIVRRAGS